MNKSGFRVKGVRCRIKSLAFASILFTIAYTLYLIPCLYSADWRAFKKTPERTAFAYEQAYPKLTARWSFETQGGIASSVAVYNGIVYFGSRSGSIYALNATTGEELWDYSTSNWIDSSPCIYNGRVYVASRDGYLYCLDAISGFNGPLWSYHTGGSDTSSPVVVDGKVYCATGHPQKYVYCVDSKTGTLLKSYPLDKYIYSSPALKNNMLYIGATGGKFYSLDAQNLSKSWENQTIGSIYFATMACGDNVVYGIPGDDDRKVYAFDVFSGNKLWESVELSTWTISAYVSSIALSDDDFDGNFDALYVACGFKPVKLYAIDLHNNGSIKWETFIGDATIESFLSSPVIVNDIVYIGSGDGYLYAITTSTGGVVDKYYLGSSIVATPAASNGWVYIGTLDGKMWAFQAEKITAVSAPEENTELSSVADIKGFAINPEFESYKVEYRKNAPGHLWQQIGEDKTSQVNGKTLVNWDTTDVEEGSYQLRLTVNNSNSNRALALYRVTQSTSAVISAANGGTLIHPDGTEVYFPPGALNVDDTVTIRKLNSGDYSDIGIDSNFRASSIVYEFLLGNPSANTPFNKLVTIKLRYILGNFGLAVNTNEENLRVCFWDTGKNKWRIVNTSKPHSDENPKRVWADVSHFSIYRLMEFVPGGPLLEKDKVYTYPNPAKGNTVTFKFYLSDKADVEIDIYNIAGEKIARLKKEDNPAGIVSEIIWDISDIASGVYIYRIEANSQTQSKAITEKLAIIH